MNKAYHKKNKTKKWMALAASAMLAGMLLSTSTQIASPLVKANAAEKSKQSKFNVNVDDTSLQKAIKAAKDTGVTVTQNATKSKEVSKADQEATVKAIQADYAKQQKALEDATAQQKKNNDTYNTAKAKYDKDKAAYDKAKAQYDKDEAAYEKAEAQFKKDSAQYAKDEAAYKTALDKYNKDEAAYKTAKAQYDKDKAAYDKAEAEYQKALTQYNKDYVIYQQQKADYDKKLKQYNSDYAAWQDYMKHPDYNNSTEWSKQTLDDFIGSNPANVTYISNSTGKMSLNLDSVKKLTQAQFDKFLENYKGGENTSAIDHKTGTFVNLTKGSTWTYKAPFVDVSTGKQVDVKYTVTKVDNKTSPVVAEIKKKNMGVDVFTPNMFASYKVEFLDHATGKPVTLKESLIGFGDLDSYQYIDFESNATKSIYGSKVVKSNDNSFKAQNGTGYGATDPSTQVWRRVDNCSGFSYTYGASHTNWNAPHEGDDFHATGNIDFAIKLKTPPVKPTAPKAPTKPVEPTKPTEPKAPTKPTEPKKPVEPKAPTKPTAPTAPVKKVEKASYTLTKLVVNEIKQFNAKFIEKTD